MWWWIIVAASAGSGLDPSALAVVGEPTYLAPALGWTAPVLDETQGSVRVWVYPDLAGAATQFATLREALGAAAPLLPIGADEGTGNGLDLALFRQGEVVVQVVRPEGAAGDLAGRLLAAVRDAGEWPEQPKVNVVDGALVVHGTWAFVRVAQPPLVRRRRMGDGLPVLDTRPLVRSETGAVKVTSGEQVRVLVWDAFGRGHDVAVLVP
jgi:hypothetical protein